MINDGEAGEWTGEAFMTDILKNSSIISWNKKKYQFHEKVLDSLAFRSFHLPYYGHCGVVCSCSVLFLVFSTILKIVCTSLFVMLLLFSTQEYCVGIIYYVRVIKNVLLGTVYE